MSVNTLLSRKGVKSVVDSAFSKDNAFLLATFINTFTLLFGTIWLKASNTGAYGMVESHNVLLIAFIVSEIFLGISFFYVSDLYVLLSSCVLLDMGVFIQSIFIAEEGGESTDFMNFWLGMIFALSIAVVTAVGYVFLSKRLNLKSNKKIFYIGIALMLVATLAITAMLLVSEKTSGANISFRIGSISIGLAELYKPIWVMVTAMIVCSDVIKKQRIKFVFLSTYTAVVLFSLLCCNELGTLAILLLAYFVMVYTLWGDNNYVRSAFYVITIAALAGLFLLVISFPDLSMMIKDKEIHYIDGTQGGLAGSLAPYVNKLITRTVNWLCPLKTVGSQAATSYKANISGGLLGNNQTFSIPVQQCDYTFSGVVLRLGFLFGVVIAALYLIILIRTVIICENKKREEKGFTFLNISAYAAVMVLTLSAFISIGGNSSLLPLTGIVIPLIARGTTANMISMFFLTLILFNSAQKKPKKSKKEITQKKLKRTEECYCEKTI